MPVMAATLDGGRVVMIGRLVAGLSGPTFWSRATILAVFKGVPNHVRTSAVRGPLDGFQFISCSSEKQPAEETRFAEDSRGSRSTTTRILRSLRF